MAEHKKKVLHQFPFAEKDHKNAGNVEVVHRTSTFDGGNTREFIDLNIRIGERFMGIPVRHIDEIIEALQNAKPVAEEEMAKLPPPPPFEQRHGGDRRDRGHGRHGGDRRNRYNED